MAESQPLTAEDDDILRTALGAKKAAVVINKDDLGREEDMSVLCESGLPVFRVSAACGTGIDELAKFVSDEFSAGAVPDGGILTNVRQQQAAQQALDALRSAQSAIEDGITPDAALTGIEAALEAVGTLTGRSIREDTTARIFERFCVGK